MLGSQSGDTTSALCAQNTFSRAPLAFLQTLAYADDRREPGLERSLRLLQNSLIGFMKVLAAFAMSDNDPAAPDRSQHGRGNLPGIGSLAEPKQVLPADFNRSPARRFDRCRQIYIRRADHNLRVGRIRNQRGEGFEKGRSLTRRLVHLPIAGQNAFAHTMFRITVRKGGS